MNKRRKAAPRRPIEPRELCSCGLRPEFDSIRVGERVRAFFACPAAPRGCGKAGGEHEDSYADQAAAAALWDSMRKKEKQGG